MSFLANSSPQVDNCWLEWGSAEFANFKLCGLKTQARQKRRAFRTQTLGYPLGKKHSLGLRRGAIGRQDAGATWETTPLLPERLPLRQFSAAGRKKSIRPPGHSANRG